jgi:hypothetical protein
VGDDGGRRKRGPSGGGGGSHAAEGRRGSVRLSAAQRRGWEGVQAAGRGAPAVEVGGGRDRGFKQVKSISKEIQTILNNFKSMQTSTDPKGIFPCSNFFK